MPIPNKPNVHFRAEETELLAARTSAEAHLTSPANPVSHPTCGDRGHKLPFDLCDARPDEAALTGALYSSLIMWPVILQGGLSERLQGGELAISAQLTRRLAESVKDLAMAKSSVCLLRDLFDYSFIACNTPAVYQKMLEQMAGRFRQVTAPAQPDASIDVDRFENGIYEEAPTLHFLIGSLTRIGRWPELGRVGDPCGVGFGVPTAKPPMPEELASLLEEELGVNGEQGDCVLHVGEADFAASAIETGIKSWLTVLHNNFPFDRWEALPQPDDRVDLCIALQDTQRPYMYIPLRTYQLGVAGVQRVLTHMAALSDMAVGGMQDCSIQ